MLRSNRSRTSFLLLTLLWAWSVAAANDFDLASLAWIAGSWVSENDSGSSEEVWIPPLGGAMLGVHRDVRNGRMVSFEFLRIEQREDGIYYVASPGGKGATAFRLVELEGRRAVFENKAHDFPQRIIYWLGDDDALHARVEGPRDGKTASLEWAWPRRQSR